jgi:hypothetical protein
MSQEYALELKDVMSDYQNTREGVLALDKKAVEVVRGVKLTSTQFIRDTVYALCIVLIHTQVDRKKEAEWWAAGLKLLNGRIVDEVIALDHEALDEIPNLQKFITDLPSNFILFEQFNETIPIGFRALFRWVVCLHKLLQMQKKFHHLREGLRRIQEQ